MSIFKVLFGKKEDTSSEVSDNVRPNIGISLDSESVAEEEAANERANAYIRETVKRCGYIKAEKLDEFFVVADDFFSVGSHINVETHISSGDVLNVAEKKALGLNTRKRYSRWFIELFEPSAFRNIDPKEWVNNISLAAWHRAHREKSLARMKKGDIMRVNILNCGDERDCKYSAQLSQKNYQIDDVPELPHSKCDAAYCRCLFVPRL